jgi:hypothetical protein
MYKQIGKLSGIAVAFCIMFPAMAQDVEPVVEDDGVDVHQCINLRTIRRTDIVDDRNVLFYMHGDTVYHNILPRQCHGLARENRFSYTTTIGRLCSLDTIRVLYDGAFGLQQGAGCTLGTFHKITREDAKALKETPVNQPTANPLPMPEPQEVGAEEDESDTPDSGLR